MADAPSPETSDTPETDDIVEADDQLPLATPAAHVCVILDRHTREIGLAHVAAIKRQLAASAARRAGTAAVSGRSGRAA